MARQGFSFWLTRFLPVIALALVLVAIARPSQAERRAAVVIGNDEYPFAALTNPRNDARLIASTLTDLGFGVLLFYDIKTTSVTDLEEAIRSHLVGADMAVLYFAGHAVQYRGQNLLLPVDVRTGSAQQVFEDAIALDKLIDIVNNDPVGIKLIILDACRNNPVAGEEDLQAGLANTESGSGQVLIAFATAAGEVAYDGTGVNSPYSTALANALRQPNQDIYDVFRTVRGSVRSATDGLQIPWITGSIESRFVFRHVDEGQSEAPAVASESGLTIDAVLWHFISTSSDPEDFARFAEVFPHSVHAAEAIRRSQVAVAALTERGVFIGETLSSTTISADLPADSETEAAAADFIFQQAGERSVDETFRIWPRQLPDTQRGMKTMVNDCDLYAADPNDPQRAVPGVTNGMVNVRDGLRACAFALAADQGNPRLQFQLGRVLEIAGRYDWAEQFYKLAGDQQYSAALVNLGYMARVGIGRDVDYALALEYYLRAAALGNLRARTNVGTAFIRGEGVPKSPEEGILWYRLAASSGWANAITALGDSYRRGVGVEENLAEAARLYAAAADTGQIDAMSNLGRAYISGSGIEKDVRRGLDLLMRATGMGNQYAPYHAARLLLKGDGDVAPDRDEARDLLELSARRGFENAYLELAKGYLDGIWGGGEGKLRLAYYNAALAMHFKVDGAEEVADSIASKLDPTARRQVEDEVELFIEQNGN